jgi:hypothetical protein
VRRETFCSFGFAAYFDLSKEVRRVLLLLLLLCFQCSALAGDYENRWDKSIARKYAVNLRGQVHFFATSPLYDEERYELLSPSSLHYTHPSKLSRKVIWRIYKNSHSRTFFSKFACERL